MSDQPNTTDNQNDDGPKQLRDALARRESDLEAERERSRRLAFKMAGFDPEKGMGKAIWNSYEGDPDPDSIVAHAKDEYDWEATTQEQPQGNVDQGQQTRTPPPATVPPAQQRMQNIASTGSPDQPFDLNQQIQEAEAKGEWEKAGRLKDQRIAQRITAR